MNDLGSDAWLSLDEAARRLGASRLRVREAIAAGVLRGQRDNRGFWRVSLAGGGDLATGIASVQVAPAQLVEILFDEVEEASASLAERNADVERLSALVARQQDLIERALRLAEVAESPQKTVQAEQLASLNERSQALADRALTALETRDAELVKVTGLLDRAMGAAAGLDAEVARQVEISQRQRALLDRVFAVAQAGLERFAPGPRGGWFSRWRGSRGEPG
jgi:excisionase family DNA binding protein